MTSLGGYPVPGADARISTGSNSLIEVVLFCPRRDGMAMTVQADKTTLCRGGTRFVDGMQIRNFIAASRDSWYRHGAGTARGTEALGFLPLGGVSKSCRRRSGS